MGGLTIISGGILFLLAGLVIESITGNNIIVEVFIYTGTIIVGVGTILICWETFVQKDALDEQGEQDE